MKKFEKKLYRGILLLERTPNMNLQKQIFDTLKQEERDGLNQEELALKHNISQAHIQRILCRKSNLDNLRLKTFETMFPNAVVFLNGDNNITQSASNISVKNGSVNTISMNSGTSAEQIRARIIAALIPLDIQPDALQTVLRTINELDLG